MISTESNRKVKSLLAQGGASAVVDPAVTLLSSLEGWWDPSTYSGSGNLLNKGTAGSALDMVLGAATAAPTFATNKFTFDGTNDIMSCPNNSVFAVTTAEDFHLGMVCAFPTTPISYGSLIGKWAGPPGYYMTTDDTNCAAYVECSATGTGTALSAAGTTGVKMLLSGSRNHTTDTVKAWRYNVAGSVTDGSTVALSNSAPFEIGKFTTGGGFQRFEMYGAFFSKRELTAAELLLIATYYGASTPPSFRSETHFFDALGNQTHNLAAPAGAVAGDLLIASCYGFSANVSMTAAGGQTWTLVSDTNGSAPSVRTWWCIYTGSLSTLTFGYAGSNAWNGVLAAYKDVNATTPMDVAPTTSAAGSPVAMVVPGITPVTNNTLRIIIAGNNNETAGGATSYWTVAPSGHTVRFNLGSGGYSSSSLALTDIVQATAGAAPAETFTATGNSARQLTHLVLRPK